MHLSYVTFCLPLTNFWWILWTFNKCIWINVNVNVNVYIYIKYIYYILAHSVSSEMYSCSGAEVCVCSKMFVCTTLMWVQRFNRSFTQKLHMHCECIQGQCTDAILLTQTICHPLEFQYMSTQFQRNFRQQISTLSMYSTCSKDRFKYMFLSWKQ